jgi:predicted negative regulator of RcsB-dependent stress response
MLGRAHYSSGNHAKGEALLYRAEREFAETGSLHWQARVREWLGEAAESYGDTGQARQRYAAARETYAKVASAGDVERLKRRLDGLATQPPATP